MNNKKRILSLLTALTMSASAFAGLAFPASADEIDDSAAVESTVELEEVQLEAAEESVVELFDTTTYYSQNFESETAKGTDNSKTADKEEDNLTLTDSTKWYSKYGAAGMSIAKDNNSDINMYYKYEIGSTSGQRASYWTPTSAAQTLDENKRSVFEMDFYMSGSGAGNQIVLTDSATTSMNTNDAYTGNYAIALYQSDKDTIAVNTLNGSESSLTTTTGYASGTWAHIKGVMNFDEKTLVVSITSLDGQTTYLAETKVAMKGDSNAAPGILVISEPRNNSSKCGVDNIVFRQYEDGDITGTYYMATISIDGTTSTRTANKTTGLISDVTDPTKTGYLFKGWNKDDDTDTLYTTEQILAAKLTADVTYTAVFEADANYIEPLESIEFSSFPTDGIAAAGADENTAESNEIQVKLIGELGTDLISDGAPKDSRVEDLDVKWEFDGFRTVVSKNAATTDSADSNEYCDSYAKVVEDENDPTKVDFQLKSQAFNFYGQVKVTVTYNGKTITLSQPMSVLPTKTVVSGQILPKPGYISDFSLLEDTMVGYQATTSSDNKTATDIVTGDWAAYGGNSGRGLYIAEDETTGDKFLKLKATGTNSSCFAANKIDEPTGQVIISQDVRFYKASSSILYKSDNPVSWTTGKATTMSVNFTGTGFNLNGGATFATATTGVWYHIVMSADVTSKMCYAIVYDSDNNLIGKSDTVAFADAGSVTPIYLCYRTPDSSTGELDFNNVKVYTPEIQGDLVTTISNDTLILPSDEDGVSYSDGKVTVKKTGIADDTEAKLINASYSDGKLSKITVKDLKFKDNTATVELTPVNGSTMMVWNSLEEMVPLMDSQEISTADASANVATLTVDALSTEGYSMIGDATWSVTDASSGLESSLVTIVADEDNSHNATLTAAKGAPSGTYNVTVTMGGKTKVIPVTVTGTQDSVKFTSSTSSIAIPLENGASDTYTYSAIVTDKDGNDLNKTVTYALYDKNNANEITTALTGISFNKETGALTVTSEAAATTVNIRATSTNSDNETISRSVKVDIHGLAFDFGSADEVADGYTAVTSTSAYTEAAGYGIASGTPTIGGTADDTADSDNLTGTFKFQAKVEAKKIYKVTVNYSGSLASEYVNADLTGVAYTNATQSAVTYEVPVIDDVLDLTFTNATVSSIVIEKEADKQAGGKPNIYTIGDSTIANNGSWAYCLARDIANYTDLSSIATFSNNGRGGKNLSTYYTGGELIDRVLTQVKPGDYVMIGDMGTNGMGSKFEESFNYYIDACEAMGAKVILNSYSPHGAVGDYASGYNSTTHTFTSYRQDSYDNIVRSIYAERSDATNEKYDENIVGFVDIGKMADAAFNAYVADYATNEYADEDAAAQAIIACFGDHNHYSNGTIAAQLMIAGYGTGDDAKGIVKTLVEILTADLTSSDSSSNSATDSSSGSVTE